MPQSITNGFVHASFDWALKLACLIVSFHQMKVDYIVRVITIEGTFFNCPRNQYS